jgi:FtsP/CotA-like multicopper oxidase with cupredoxin domain
MRKQLSTLKCVILLSSLLIAFCTCVAGTELQELPVFSSDTQTKTLDILLIATPTAIADIPGVTGWGYQICLRQDSQGNACLPGKSNPNPYGGARLQLNPGDRLKVHFVNKLPKISHADHASESGKQFLALNPSNIHTHGLLVPPNGPSATHTAYGDNIAVLTFNSANGEPNLAKATHLHAAVNKDATDYQIDIPQHHPAGIYWFHPHAHGISLNQISAGLAGLITIGQIEDYLPDLPADINTRHLILKDIQINGDKTLNTQEEPELCHSRSSVPGICSGKKGAKWYYTVNGQLNPLITVKPKGEIWRITNASGNVTYDLQLKTTHKDRQGIVMQLLSIDGMTTEVATADALNRNGGSRFDTVNCPGLTSKHLTALCVSTLHMMPGTRAELWVAKQDPKNQYSGQTQAILQTKGYSTGASGDNWPTIDLARVQFSGALAADNMTMQAVHHEQHDHYGLNLTELAQDLQGANNEAVMQTTDCQPLPEGWKRRIFFGIPPRGKFGMGFELVDENGQAVPGSLQNVEAFSQMKKSICLPLAAGNQAVTERWELINLAREDHNFHIHQTKFKVITHAATDDAELAAGILQDSVALFAGGNTCDGTLESWKKGVCKTESVQVEIPFIIAGDYVYHCHILEHEDGGMMAKIRVANAGKSQEQVRSTVLEPEPFDDL